MTGANQPNRDDETLAAEFSTAGMLLKLVLLPGLVASGIVLVGLLIGWVTRPTGDVESLIEQLARQRDTDCLAAVNLAAALREPAGAAARRDPAIARRLGEVLHRELEAGGTDHRQIELRKYLCRALGEFQVAEALPVLLEAAQTERDEKKVEVRCSAIEAIAVLASNVPKVELRDDRQRVDVLLAAAEDQRVPVRQRAAFALGVIGGERAEDRLETMLADPSPEVRYNAATGLARHGNSKCIEILVEMLDADRRNSQRAIVLMNALRATGQLAAANPRADVAELRRAAERLARARLDPQVHVQATEVLHQLENPR